MLRSLFFSLATLAVITVVFLFYWRMQASTATSGPAAPPGTPTTGPSDQMQYSIGHGERAWVNRFDEKGQLASQFHADEYTPQPDRSFKVEKPVNVFYLNDGQFMVVTGDTGTVYVDAVTGAKDPMSTNPLPVSMQSPNKGILHNVHIKLFPSRNATDPTLWLDVNNIAFDNDTLRIYTQGYTDENAAAVPPDQVPVTVRGDDYEFDGSGLTLNWNDRDRRLQLLEVAHGGRLMIKNPAKMSLPGSPSSTKANVTSAVSNALPEALVAAAPQAAAQVLAPATKPTTSPVKLPYRAVFNENVRVEQGDRQMAAADIMSIDFLPGGGGQPPSKAKPTIAATLPTAADNSLEPKAPPAAEQLVTGQAAAVKTPAPSTSPAPTSAASAKTTKKPPITVYWTGKLRITSLDSPPQMPLTSGQAAVRFVGRPVELTPPGTTLHAAAVTYRNDGAVVLENSPTLPIVEMKQDRGMMFAAESIDYDPATQLATILGRSDLRTASAQGKEPLTASWTRKGVLHFVGNPSQPDYVDRADLDGHVRIDHPSFNLKSNQLALDMTKFAVPATKPGEPAGSDVSVKRATAVGDVQCRLLNPGKPDRGIDGDRLVLETSLADGKPVPRSVVADGSVHAFDLNQEIFAGHLESVMTPKAPQAVSSKTNKAGKSADDGDGMDLESLYAKSNVHAKLKSGAIADADELHVTTKDGKQEIELRGQPMAAVSDGKGSSLTGPVLHVSPDPLVVTVDGAGAMHKLRRATTRSVAQPIDVSWTDSMTFDGAANMIDAIGGVTVVMKDGKGTVDTMTSDRAHLDLADAKPAKGTTKPAQSELGDKELKAMLLQGRVNCRSELKDADGTTLRLGELSGEKLIYDSASGRMQVPGAGWIVMVDHRPAKAGSGNRGSLAIQWKEGLTYDQAKHQVIITGDKTTVGFKKETKDAAPMQLYAQRIVIDVQPDKQGSAESSIQVTHVHAEGQVKVLVVGKPQSFIGHTIDYDPAAEEVIARGSDEEPGLVLDDQNASTGSFKELVIDTKTQEVDRSKGVDVKFRK